MAAARFRFRFVFTLLWICLSYLIISRKTRSTAVDSNGDILFAPSQLISSGKSSVLICVWRRSSRLGPHLQRPLFSSFSGLYWLILLAGDVEANPGPVKFPCTVCQKPVKTNQRGVCCDVCDLWTHVNCARLKDEEYRRLSFERHLEWMCPLCVLGSLPFPDLDNGVLEGTSAHVFPQLVSSITTADQNFSFLPGSLSYAHLNVQSLAPKLEEIQIFLQRASGHVILGLSETWLGDLFSDLAVSVASYISYRRDRPHGRGGGLLVYVPETLRSRRRYDLEPQSIEAIWVEVWARGSQTLLCNLYNPPNTNVEFLEELGYMLEVAVGEKKEIIIMGDFNCDVNSPSSMTNQLLSIMSEYQLTQTITESIRVPANSRTLIDHCYVTSSMASVPSGVRSLAGSDHYMIYITLQSVRKSAKAATIKQVRSFKKCNVDNLLNDMVKTPWDVIDTFDDADDGF